MLLKTILAAGAFLALIGSAQAATVGGTYPLNAANTEVLTLSGKTFEGKNMSELFEQAKTDCAVDSTTRARCLSFFGYADPRWYGAYCGSNATANNNTEDDAPGIQAALDTGKNVYMPVTCKVANRVKFKADGQRIMLPGTGGAYNSNYPGNAYIFLPNDLWRGGPSVSTSSVSISSSGDKSFTVKTGLPWVVGMHVDAYYDSSKYMQGTVKSYDSATGALVMTSNRSAGSGTYSSWIVDQSLNCAFDTNGYDNVGVDGMTVRANYNLVGSTALCNSVGIRSGRGAAFLKLNGFSALNLGNALGAGMSSIYDYRGTATDTHTLGTGSFSFTTDGARLWTAGQEITATAVGVSPTTTMVGTVTSYDTMTGVLVMNSTSTSGTVGTYSSWSFNSSNSCIPVSAGPRAQLRNNVFQFYGSDVNLIGTCMGMYGNFTDFHLRNFYAASIVHNAFSSLSSGYGLSGTLESGRIEYSGFGEGPTGAKTYYNYGVGIWYNSGSGYLNVSNVSFDHQKGACIRAESVGSRKPHNLALNNVVCIGPYYGATASFDDAAFVFKDVQGLSASNVSTYRNGVSFNYVARFDGANSFVNWNGTGGAQGSGAETGQWQTSYFDFVTNPTNFFYTVPGVGEYNLGNSSTAITLHGAYKEQKVTATGNATVTMPTGWAGLVIDLRYFTGAGGFTATFTGVKWAGSAPTLTATAARMDKFRFTHDGSAWYGQVIGQNYTP